MFASVVLAGLVGLLAPAVSGAAVARTPPPTSTRAPGAGDCPFDVVAGQIKQVVGPADQVMLQRGGRPVAIYPNRCILYGDRLKVGPDALVRVSTAAGVREFGKGGTPVWAPQGREPGGASAVIASIRSAVGTLFGRDSNRHEYAVGRGLDACRDDQYSGQPVAAVSRLPAVPQTIGSDLRQMAVAWKFGGASSRITLVAADGAIVAEARTCNTTTALLALPPGRQRPGERLTLTIEDTQGGALRYPIEIVAAGRLERPAKPVDGWLLGAWRLTGGDNALRLDGLSRLAAGADHAYAARRIIDAVADDEAF